MFSTPVKSCMLRPGKAGELVKRFKQLEPIMKELGQNRAQHTERGR